MRIDVDPNHVSVIVDRNEAVQLIATLAAQTAGLGLIKSDAFKTVESLTGTDGTKLSLSVLDGAAHTKPGVAPERICPTCRGRGVRLCQDRVDCEDCGGSGTVGEEEESDL